MQRESGSHFIWIEDDASEIVMVSSTEVVEVLLRVNNQFANRRPENDEVDDVDVAFGLGGRPASYEWSCICCKGCGLLAGYS